MFFKRDLLTKKIVVDIDRLETFLMLHVCFSLATLAIAVAAYVRSL